MVERSLDQELDRGWRSAAASRPPSRWRRLARDLLAPLPLRPPNVQRIRNVSYGEAGRRNRLDIYRRRGPAVGPGPVLVHFHGGHFQIGGKSREARPLLHRLASQGWVCISATYRLGAAGRFPNSVIDAKRVISWVRSHAAEYGADPRVLIVAGSSAGAHLASMAALTPNEPAFQPGFEDAGTTVSAAVCLYGYYGEREAAGPLPSTPEAYVSCDAPPFLIAHGDSDTLIPIDHADRFAQRLRSTATSTVTVKVSAVGSPLTAAASAVPTSGQVPLNVAFTGSASGGTPPCSYSWNFGDGSATSTAQNPSHTYSNAGNYTATLTVTDSASPPGTASSAVPISATPIAGTPPGPPTALTGSPGNGQVSLSWTAPANTGGVQISGYRVYRGTTSGGETLVTTGGCGGLGNVTSCTDTGLTNGQQYFYEVSAVNALGEGNKSNEAAATPTSGTCPPAQLLGNPGFETGTAAPWSASSGVVNDNTQEPPHSGSWDAWLDGYGTTHTDTLSQTVTLPAGCPADNLSFWLHIDTAETTTTTKYDTLKVQLLNSSGTVLATLHTYSNLDHNTGYTKQSFSLSAYAGQKITLKFTGAEDYELQTSFVIDDTAINVG